METQQDTIFIQNLPKEIGEQGLADHFGGIGVIKVGTIVCFSLLKLYGHDEPYTFDGTIKSRSVKLIFFLAHLCLCTVGSYTSLCVCPSGRDWTKIQTRH